MKRYMDRKPLPLTALVKCQFGGNNSTPLSACLTLLIILLEDGRAGAKPGSWHANTHPRRYRLPELYSAKVATDEAGRAVRLAGVTPTEKPALPAKPVSLVWVERWAHCSKKCQTA